MLDYRTQICPKQGIKSLLSEARAQAKKSQAAAIAGAVIGSVVALGGAGLAARKSVDFSI